MRTNLNTIFTFIGVSFFSVNFTLAQTWYDSEGRPLIIKGKKIIRKEVEEKGAVASSNPIIPKALEVKPELISKTTRARTRKVYPYLRYYFGSYDRSYSGYRSCYRARKVRRNSCYLNYRRGDFSIRAGY